MLWVQVADEAAGVSYSGSSPTQPWTAICLAHRKTQRISGELMLLPMHAFSLLSSATPMQQQCRACFEACRVAITLQRLQHF